MEAVSITDHGSMSGAIEFYQAAIRPSKTDYRDGGLCRAPVTY